MSSDSWSKRLQQSLNERDASGLRRSLRVWENDPSLLNLAANDYLGLAHDPSVIAAAIEAATRYGCSASSSPLISGFQPPHQELEAKLCRWHGFPHGLLWNSGYAANQALLSRLPRSGDLVLADRLIHHSMVSGILQSGARLIRYRHNDIEHLESLLAQHASDDRVIFVVTESVFSMDGDSPDLKALANLKQTYPFCLILDEAHGTGWYGPSGAGLAAEVGILPQVDILVGTLGKALGSQGAYTLFHNPSLREYLINEAGEFIFSTYLSPIAAAAGSEAIRRCQELTSDQSAWRQTSKNLRQNLRADGWDVPEGDSPILPLHLGDATRTTGFAGRLRQAGILVGAVRPPTVPAGTSRLRISLQRTFGETEETRFLHALRTLRSEFPA